MPLRLSDVELTAVMNACPLSPAMRDDLLQEIVSTQCGEIGPGSLHRLLVGMQRAFFYAPNLDGAEEEPRPRFKRGKWRR